MVEKFNEKEVKINRIYLKNGGINVLFEDEEGNVKDTWLNTMKEDREKLIDKLKEIGVEKGDKVLIEGFGTIYTDIKIKEKNPDNNVKIETQRVSSKLKEQMQPIGPQTFEDQKWERINKEKQDMFDKKNERDFKQMAKLAAQKNTIMILDIMERMELLKGIKELDIEKLKKIKQVDYYKELMEDWDKE